MGVDIATEEGLSEVGGLKGNGWSGGDGGEAVEGVEGGAG